MYYLVNGRIKKLTERIIDVYRYDSNSCSFLEFLKFSDGSLALPNNCIELSFKELKKHLFLDIYQRPRHICLSQRQAIWWVCYCLQISDTYQSKIQADLRQYPNLKLSNSVLIAALDFLVSKKLVTSYQQPIKGRGAARKMYQVSPDGQAIVNDFANLWKTTEFN